MTDELTRQRRRESIQNPHGANREETLGLIRAIDSAVPQDSFAREYADDMIQRLRDGYWVQSGERL